MRVFIIKLIKIFLVFIGAIWVVGLAMEYKLYRNTRDVYYVRQGDWHLYHPKKIKALFIGNSRMSVQVDMPTVINKWGVPVYSLCQDARAMRILWFKFKKYTERNEAPKAVILQLDITSLNLNGSNNKTFYGKEKYLSYLFANQLGINDCFKKDTGFYWYETVVPLVRYFAYPAFFTKHWNKEYANPYASPANFGSCLINYDKQNKLTPLFDSVTQKPLVNLYRDAQLDFTYVDSFYYYCSRNAIDLVAIMPPHSYSSYRLFNPNYLKKMEDYCKEKKLSFRNFNHPNYDGDSLFFNHLHVNENGAMKFTNELITYLDSLGIKQKVQGSLFLTDPH